MRRIVRRAVGKCRREQFTSRAWGEYVPDESHPNSQEE